MASNSLSDFDHFFGGDQKGHVLVGALFQGENFTQSVPSYQLTELLKAGNYNNYENNRSKFGVAQGPNDVHQDITDLIINTAIYHRSIDNPTTLGTNIDATINAVQNLVATLIVDSTKLGAVPALPKALLTDAAAVADIEVTYNHVAIVNWNYIDFLVYALGDLAGFSINPPIGGAPVDNTKINAFVDVLKDMLTTDMSIENIYTAFGNSATVAAIAAGNAKAVIIGAIKKKLTADITILYDTMYRKSLQPALRTTLPFPDAGGIALRRSAVQGYCNSNMATLSANLKQVIKDSIRTGIVDLINLTHTLPRTKLDEPGAQAFCNSVYGKWPTLPSHIKQFYFQNIGVFAKRNSTAINRSLNAEQYKLQNADWIRLADADIANINKLCEQKDDLRLNLLKNPSLDTVLFASNLPDVPVNAKVWYTNDTGTTLEVLPYDKNNKLREIYKMYYSGQTLPSRNPVPVQNAGPINLNYRKYIQACLSGGPSNVPVSSTNADLDYPFLENQSYDMVYGGLWSYDTHRNQYYKLVEGKKVYYDDDTKQDTGTCYRTYLSKGDRNKCHRVIDCIISNNPKSLNQCLDVLDNGTNPDMWEVATEDIKNVDPDMIKAVLKKFGVKGYVNGGIREPETYEAWLNRLDTEAKSDPSKKDVYEKISKNTKLTTYLSALISICRANPSILNKNVPDVVARDNTPEWVNAFAGKIKPYKVISTPSQTPDIMNMLGRNFVQDLNPNPSGLLFPIMNGYYPNAVPLNNQFPNQWPQLGGAGAIGVPKANAFGNGTGSMVQKYITYVKNAAADVGIQFHPDDHAKLDAVVKKIHKYEEDFTSLFTLLIKIIDLARMFGININNIDRNKPRVLKLGDIKSEADANDFVRHYANEINKNMVTNLRIQQGVTGELMNNVGPKLLGECVGTGDLTNNSRTLQDIF